MLALPVSVIAQIFGTSLNLHVKILPIDPYFSLDILKI